MRWYVGRRIILYIQVVYWSIKSAASKKPQWRRKLHLILELPNVKIECLSERRSLLSFSNPFLKIVWQDSFHSFIQGCVSSTFEYTMSVYAADWFLPSKEQNISSNSTHRLRKMRASLPFTSLPTFPQISSLWVYTEFSTSNQHCGLCINEAGMTEITKFSNIAQYSKEFAGAWEVHPQLSAHCYWFIMNVIFPLLNLSWVGCLLCMLPYMYCSKVFMIMWSCSSVLIIQKTTHTVLLRSSPKLHQNYGQKYHFLVRKHWERGFNVLHIL